jgi:soluble lytic murein transglycosylase-like protein
MIIPDCLPDIATYYQVPQLLVQSIMIIEGGKVGDKIGPNRNKTYDLGVMQINTIWEKELNKKFRIDEHALIWNECTNIAVGTWILASRYVEFNNDWTTAIMAYNAGYKLENGRKYAEKVLTVWNKLHNKQSEQTNNLK